MPQVFLGTSRKANKKVIFFLFVLKVSAPRFHTEEPSGVEDARGTVGRGGGRRNHYGVMSKT